MDKNTMKKKLMKRIVLLAVGCLLCGEVRSQHQQLFDAYLREAGDQAEMFVGKAEAGYPPTIYFSHPYWLFNEFFPGDVKYNGVTYRNVPLRFDAYLQQLVVNTPVKRSNVCVPMHLVESFTLGGTEYARRNGEFMAILFDSPRMELVERVHIVRTEEHQEKGKVMYDFKREVKYFVLRGGQTYEVDKLKTVLKLYPGIKGELRRFAKQHSLDFKEHRQSSLIQIVRHADHLLTQSVEN